MEPVGYIPDRPAIITKVTQQKPKINIINDTIPIIGRLNNNFPFIFSFLIIAIIKKVMPNNQIK